MNVTTKVTVKALAAVAALTMSAVGATDLGQFGHSSHKASIHGVWTMRVTLVNCSTGAALAPDFAAVNTFHAGGTMSEHGARFSPALRNNGQGVWKQVGPNRFSSRFLFQRFDVNGLYVGTQEVTRKSTVSDDGKTLSSTASVRILDMDGVLIAQGCATEVGSRF